MRTRIPPLGPFERSPFRDALENRLLRMRPDEIVHYGEWSRIAGGDVQADESARSLLYRARDAVRTQHRIITDAIPGIGIKRLTDEGAVAASDHYMQRQRRAVRRGLHTLHGVREPDKMPEPIQRRYQLNQLRFGLLKLIGGRRVERKLLASSVTSVHQVRDRFLALFRGRS